jgi:RHS repeat-associated protein
MKLCNVNLSSGEVLVEVTDFDLPGWIPVEFGRRYKTTALERGPLGMGWFHNFDRTLRVDGGSLVWRNERGDETVFTEAGKFASGTLNFDRSRDVLVLRGPGNVRTVFGAAAAGDAVMPLVTRINAAGHTFPLELPRGAHLLRHPNGAVTHVDGQGTRTEFPGGAGTSQGGLRLEQPDDVFVLGGAGPAQYYGPSGAGRGTLSLLALQDGDGNAVRFSHEGGRLRGIVDSVDRHIGFTYHPSGLLDEVLLEAPSMPGGWVRLMKYEQDGGGDLVRVHDRLGVLAEYDYADHLLVCHRNANGMPTFVEYDASRRCSTLYREGGKGLRRFRYDPVRRNTLVTDSLGATTLYRFNDAGSLTEEVDVRANCRRRMYDGDNRLLLATGPDDSPTVVSMYDEKKRTLTEQRPVGGATVTVFGENGLPVRVTNALGQTRFHEYDGRGRLVALKAPSGRTWRYEYGPRGSLARVTCPDGYVLHREQAEDFSAVTVRDDWGLVERCRYDLFGNVVQTTGATGAIEGFEYDARDRLVRHTLPDGTSVTYTYDGEGNLLSETDALGRTTRYAYDGYTLLTERSDPAGARVRYEADAEDRLVALVNERGERTVIEYDALGRPTRSVYFDGRWEKTEYDALGRIVLREDSDGGVTRAWFDGPTMMVRRRLPGGTEQRFGYDAVGRLVSIDATDYSHSFEYDADGRVSREAQPNGQVEYEYNAGGLLAATRDSSGREVRYEYDRRRALRRIVDRGRIYDIGGTGRGELVTEIGHPGGLRQELRYDPRERLVRRRVISPAGTELARREYAYDAADQLVKMADTRLGDFEYAYDVLGRLVEVRRGGAAVEAYAYDAAGNLTRTPAAGAIRHAAGNRAVATAAGVTYEYDGCGRRTADVSAAGRRIYEYDGEGMLRRVSPPAGDAAEFEYDAFCRRTTKRVGADEVRFLWDANLPRSEERLVHRPDGGGDGAVTQRVEYLFLPDSFVPITRRVDDTDHHYSFDQGGTPSEMWDGSGNMVWSSDPDAYGARRNEAGPAENPIHFMGQYVDAETGLHYNRFRYYDPCIGRFTTQDPLGLMPGPNMYFYPANPLTWVDPLGLISGPTLQLVCNSDWKPCEQMAAQMKVNAMHAQSQKKQLKRADPCRTNQRDYYEKKCATPKEDSGTHDIDHLLELQVGGMDKCCQNLWEMPRSPNRSIGSQIKNRMNDAGLKVGSCIGGFSISGCTKASKCTKPPTPPNPASSCEEAGIP